jgi:hypothetical protein
VPSGDTTYYSNFWGDSNQDVNTSEPTVYLWYGQVNADRDFTGRTVMEQQGPPGNDACFFEGSLALKFDHVTGGSWNVNTPALFYNGYAFDEVGWTSQGVNYYRGQGRAPCMTTFYQNMVVICNGGAPQFFATNTLTATIGTTDVGSSRADKSVSKTWP